MLIVILVLVALIGVGVIFRRIKRFINGGDPVRKKETERKNDNVIYNKDDIVVLKGEAHKNKKEYND
jgi:hypothetical protein